MAKNSAYRSRAEEAREHQGKICAGRKFPEGEDRAVCVRCHCVMNSCESSPLGSRPQGEGVQVSECREVF